MSRFQIRSFAPTRPSATLSADIDCAMLVDPALNQMARPMQPPRAHNDSQSQPHQSAQTAYSRQIAAVRPNSVQQGMLTSLVA